LGVPSTFARIGRSYPRAQPQPVQVAHAPGGRRLHLKITGGLVVLVSALSVAGWLFLR
jgi:hypothetical protein